ncbi:MAG: acyltransferase family protein, partial [Nevskiales bacterium]
MPHREPTSAHESQDIKPGVPMTVEYRADIDGLRAIAVILVILYHAKLPFFQGGYIGVDVFFVISGYLITGILLNDASRHQLSIFAFYERRIRRIYPALFLVLAVSACAAIGLMLPDELESHARSLLSATFFFANYHSMFDGGYFAAPAEVKPLLHVWSLAVEEQFYLVFPLYLSLMLRYGRRAAGTVTLVV